MLRYLSNKARPQIKHILEDALYQYERDVIDQEARCHELDVKAEQAHVILKHKQARLMALRLRVDIA